MNSLVKKIIKELGLEKEFNNWMKNIEHKRKNCYDIGTRVRFREDYEYRNVKGLEGTVTTTPHFYRRDVVLIDLPKKKTIVPMWKTQVSEYLEII